MCVGNFYENTKNVGLVRKLNNEFTLNSVLCPTGSWKSLSLCHMA